MTITVADVSEALTEVEDPELGLDLVELGLIYDIAVEGSAVKIIYSLTSLGCPAGQYLEDEIRRVTAALPGVTKVSTELTWSPPWSPERMSDDAKFALGILGAV